MAKKTNYIPYILGAAAVGGVVLWQSGKLDKINEMLEKLTGVKK